MAWLDRLLAPPFPILAFPCLNSGLFLGMGCLPDLCHYLGLALSGSGCCWGGGGAANVGCMKWEAV